MDRMQIRQPKPYQRSKDILEPSGQKRCNRCHVKKDKTEFNRDCHTKDKLSNKCRLCINKPSEKENSDKELCQLRNSWITGSL